MLMLEHLPSGSFWVCEKSDGVRVLVLIVCVPDGPQEVYLVSAPSRTLDSYIG